MAAIEVKLRQLQFRQYNEFVPTAHQMTLNEHAFYEAMRGDELEHYPGEYAEIAYSIKELCTELEKFVASKSLAGAAAIGAAGRGGGQSERAAWAWAWAWAWAPTRTRAWARWRALARTVT